VTFSSVFGEDADARRPSATLWTLPLAPYTVWSRVRDDTEPSRSANATAPSPPSYADWTDPAGYKTGPTIWIKGGKLTSLGRDLMPIPTGQWVRMEMRGTVGAQSDGAWDLTGTLPGGERKTFARLPCGAGPLRHLTWLGFSSMASDVTTSYLDDLALTTTLPRPRARP